MRTCRICGCIAASFPNNRNRCKDCTSQYNKRYRQHNIDIIQEKDRGRSKQRYSLHKNRIKEYSRKHEREYNLNLKIAVIAHYSNGTMRCEKCEESRLGALQIDHIDGGGTQHRIQLDTSRFYLWLFKAEFPIGFRVLCANHNIIAHLESRPQLSHTKKAIKLRIGNRQRKQLVMNKLGGRCSKCGEANLDILTIHHIYNDGKKHRAEVSRGRAGNTFYRALEKLNNYDNLECYCFNCNCNDEFDTLTNKT